MAKTYLRPVHTMPKNVFLTMRMKHRQGTRKSDPFHKKKQYGYMGDNRVQLLVRCNNKEPLQGVLLIIGNGYGLILGRIDSHAVTIGKGALWSKHRVRL